MTSIVRVPYVELVSLIRDELLKRGVPPEIASIEAELAVESDLLGVSSHGVRIVPNLLKRFRESRAKAAPHWRTVLDYAAICVIDGDHGPGRFISFKAMEQAIDRAREFGIGACLATRTSHWGGAHV